MNDFYIVCLPALRKLPGEGYEAAVAVDPEVIGFKAEALRDGCFYSAGIALVEGVGSTRTLHLRCMMELPLAL